MLKYISWWFDSFELVDFDHECLLLHQLDYHCLCQLAIPLCTRGAERSALYGDLRLEILIMAARTGLADVYLCFLVGLLYLSWN
jgi:hypothetical protein